MDDYLTNSRDELIAALYGAAAELVPPSRPLELIAELTQSDKAFLARFDFLKGRGEITASLNVEPHLIETYRDIYSSQNPWLARTSYFQAEGLVWRGSEIVEPARLKETEFFKLFLYGQVISHTAHLVVQVSGREVVHVMLTRRPPADDYDDAALEICRLFTHHARRALKVTQALANGRFVEQSFSTAIDEMAAGVAIIEPPAKIVRMNSMFEALLNRSRGLSEPPQRPAAWPWVSGKRRVEVRLPRQLAEALASDPVPEFCLIPGAEDGQRPIAVKIRPTRLGFGPGGAAGSAYLLLSRSFESEIELDEAALRTAYALTAAEARVCAALVRGENIQVLSQKLCISPQTARTHLKRIYDKTSTIRQPELMRLLMTYAYRKTPRPEISKDQHNRKTSTASVILPNGRPGSAGWIGG